MLTSPFRYPGGKAKLFDFFSNLIENGHMYNHTYGESFAGGAGLALRLLGSGYVPNIEINDIDAGIYSAWISIVHDSDRFCELIRRTSLSIEEWRRQKSIRVDASNASLLELGFATFYLNRTNRSGIIDGSGPIGGYLQDGEWRLDARFNKCKLIKQIKEIQKFSNQIQITNTDALKYIKNRINKRNTILYIDPPYFEKGRKLYLNYYKKSDHLAIRDLLSSKKEKQWVLSYDNIAEIRELYREFTIIEYEIGYSAGEKRMGRELIFPSNTVSKFCNPKKLMKSGKRVSSLDSLDSSLPFPSATLVT